MCDVCACLYIAPPLQTTCEGVTISEVSGRDLCLLWSQATAVDWVFEITSAVRCEIAVACMVTAVHGYTVHSSIS